jgi:hypothetical protein
MTTGVRIKLKMKKIKIYYHCDSKKMSIEDRVEIQIFGKATHDLINKYYLCVYEYNDISLCTTNKHLNNIFKRFNNQKTNPLCFPESQKLLRHYKSHTYMSVGDVISIDGVYYSVKQFGFEKIETKNDTPLNKQQPETCL